MARAVTLLVENGTIVANANSFVTEAQIVAYAAARGVTLPASTDPELDAIAILGIAAMDYLWAQNWRGELVSQAQTTPWPRKNLNTPIVVAENEIPGSVIQAQLQLTLLSHQGVVLVPTNSGTGFLIKEKIGPIENVYSEKVGVSYNGMPFLPGVLALLDPWIVGDTTDLVPVMILSVGPYCRGG